MIEIEYTLEEGAQVPSYATDGSVGMDLHSNEPDFKLCFGERKEVSTGVSFSIPEGYEGQIRPRSGWAKKYGITVLNPPGTIDQDFRGIASVLLINFGRHVVCVRKGERIAQIVFSPVVKANLHYVTKLNQTKRGSGGFGSTGTS